MSFTTGSPLRTRPTNRTKFKPSEFDETLFGERKKSREPDHVAKFEPPWVDNGKTRLKPAPKPLLFYCPTTPSRSSSRLATSSLSASSDRRYKPVKFSPTYVDESLFGNNKPTQPDFDPPWVKKSEKKFVRPILFDYSGTLVFDLSDDERCSSRLRSTSSLGSERPTSVASSRKSGSSTPVKRPWR